MGLIRVLILYGGEWVENDNDFIRYKGGKSKVRNISEECNLEELQNVVYSTLNVDRLDYEISMQFRYKANVSVPPLDS